jgi:hypothetical protein
MRRFTKIYASLCREDFARDFEAQSASDILLSPFSVQNLSRQEDRAGIKCDRDGGEKKFRRL